MSLTESLTIEYINLTTYLISGTTKHMFMYRQSLNSAGILFLSKEIKP